MEYLEEFFQSYHTDLKLFWGDLTAKEAAKVTRIEAKRLERKLFKLAETGNEGGNENLSMLFKPLGNIIIRPGELEKCKARGAGAKSWLRIYAVRLEVNEFVISGGSIKLTRTMNERPHLLKELKKLACVCNHIREDQDDEFGFFELL
ncbi:hypothetical protein [Dyadobacter soli]|nr:hypothetical protein [Dyadobacter soli]